jgi:hypothetical protein
MASFRVGVRSRTASFCVPIWAELSGRADMQVIDDIRRCIVFVGLKTTLGFRVLGTGFFVVMEEDGYFFSYIVTAAHVLWPGRGTRGAPLSPPHMDAFIRANERNGTRVDPAPPSEWIFHPDRKVDVCALPLGMHEVDAEDDGTGPQFLDIADFALTKDNPSKYGVTLGDEIFFPSAFVGRVGENKNIPVIRIGNIAALPEEPVEQASPRHAAYLIESRSLGGVSGAPVFVNLQAWRSTQPLKPIQGVKAGTPTGVPITNKDRRQTLPYVMLGMVLGAHSGQYADDFVSETDTDIAVPKDADFNAGISVVLPAWEVVGFLKSDPLAQPRIRETQERQSMSGYKPSSAWPKRQKKETSAETKPDNPSHKEDFTLLLNAAAKTPPQGD